MNLLAILVAALAGFAVGAVWYMALARPWMRAAGIAMTPEGRPDGNGSPLPFALSGVAMILVAGMMAHVFARAGIVEPGAGLVSGLGVGLFFISPWIMINNAYAMRPFRLTLIDGGYATVGCAVRGLVLTLLA